MHISNLINESDCKEVCLKLNTAEPVICLWATGLHRQTVDVMLNLRKGLISKGYQVILFLRNNAVPIFEELSIEEDIKLTYLAEFEILKFCTFIDVLIMHDYTIHPHIPTLNDFSGKIALFPHIITMGGINPQNYWADYLFDTKISDSSINFDYNLYPNEVKRSHLSSITSIPAGYLKLDLISKLRTTKFKNTHIYIAYLLSEQDSIDRYEYNLDLLQCEEQLLIENLLQKYANCIILIHPYQEDLASRRFQSLCKKFQNNPRVRLNITQNNFKYLALADILITNHSCVKFNFAYAALIPVIELQTKITNLSGIIQTDTGYLVNSASLALEAMEKAFSEANTWKVKLLKERNKNIVNFGHTCEYICAHMQNILDDTPVKDWATRNKGNTTFLTLADYLRAFKITFSREKAWQLLITFSQIYTVAQKTIPNNTALNICFFRLAMCIFNYVDPIWLSLIIPCLNKINIYPNQLLVILQCLYKQYPKNIVVAFYLSKELLCFPTYTENFHLASIISKDVFTSSPKLGVELLKHIQNHPAKTSHLFALFFAKNYSLNTIKELAVPQTKAHIQTYFYGLSQLKMYDLLNEQSNNLKKIQVQKSKSYLLALKCVQKGILPPMSAGKPYYRLQLFETIMFFENNQHIFKVLAIILENKTDFQLAPDCLWAIILKQTAPSYCKKYLGYCYKKSIVKVILYLRMAKMWLDSSLKC